MNTKRLIQSLALAVGLLTAQLVAQQAPAGAPAGTTGLCNDGNYYSGTSKKGACKGIRELRSGMAHLPIAARHLLQRAAHRNRPLQATRPRQRVEARVRFG